MLITSKLPLLHASGINIAKLFTANISVSCQLKAGKIWRQKNGLSKLQTARGPLTDLPDYSFIGKKIMYMIMYNDSDYSLYNDSDYNEDYV